MGRKKTRFYAQTAKQDAPIIDANAKILPTDASSSVSGGVAPAKSDPLFSGKDMSAKRARAFEKFVVKKLKKEERPLLFQKLQELAFSSDKLRSTKNLGVKDALVRGAKPIRSGEADVDIVLGKTSYEQLHGNNALRVFTMTERTLSQRELDQSLSSDDEDPVVVRPLAGSADPTPSTVDHKKAFFVLVTRSEEIESQRSKLPIYAEEQAIMECIRENPVSIICGETGSGKTTQVPQFLFEAGYGHPDSDNPGIVGVTQPRRVAAVSMAERVATELGLAGQEAVAHQIRFDSTVSAETRIKFMTDGILLREISTDFLLTKYSVIILDEAHERNLNTDILVGMLSRIVRLRTDLSGKGEGKPLRLVIMSATLNIDEFMQPRLFEPLPPLVKVGARQHPVTPHFSRCTNPDHVEAAFKAVCKIHANLPPGGILIFLTGKQEIMELSKELEKKYPSMLPVRAASKISKNGNEDDQQVDENGDAFHAEEETISDEEVDGRNDAEDDFEDCSDFELDCETTSPLHILPLHSLLSPQQQQRVFQSPPEGSRLCVLATNIAETSITIPNIKYVVDSGKVKQRVYNLETGTQEYRVVWCSKASAMQRAGRAGRTGPGHCYRLFSAAVFDQQCPDFAQPEIQRVPIESLVLQLKTMGIDNVANFPLPSRPELLAVDAAEKTLLRLKALLSQPDTAGKIQLRITRLGSKMALVPLGPRWSRILVLACQDHIEGALKGKGLAMVVALVATVAVGDPFFDAHNSFEPNHGQLENVPLVSKAVFAGKPATSDLILILSAFLAFMRLPAQGRAGFCQSHSILLKKLEEMLMQYRQISGLISQVFPSIKSVEALPELVDRESRDYMRRLITESLVDRIAERTRIPGAKSILPAYRLLSCSSEEATSSDSPNEEKGSLKNVVFLHSASCMSRCPPKYLVFTESIRAEKAVVVKYATAIEQDWIPQELLLTGTSNM